MFKQEWIKVVFDSFSDEVEDLRDALAILIKK
jgi:hypothetical protein